MCGEPARDACRLFVSRDAWYSQPRSSTSTRHTLGLGKAPPLASPHPALGLPPFSYCQGRFCSCTGRDPSLSSGRVRRAPEVRVSGRAGVNLFPGDPCKCPGRLEASDPSPTFYPRVIHPPWGSEARTSSSLLGIGVGESLQLGERKRGSPSRVHRIGVFVLGGAVGRHPREDARLTPPRSFSCRLQRRRGCNFQSADFVRPWRKVTPVPPVLAAEPSQERSLPYPRASCKGDPPPTPVAHRQQREPRSRPRGLGLGG